MVSNEFVPSKNRSPCCVINMLMGGTAYALIRRLNGQQARGPSACMTGDLLTCVIGQQRRSLASAAAAAQALSTAARMAAMPDDPAGR